MHISRPADTVGLNRGRRCEPDVEVPDNVYRLLVNGDSIKDYSQLDEDLLRYCGGSKTVDGNDGSREPTNDGSDTEHLSTIKIVNGYLKGNVENQSPVLNLPLNRQHVV